MDRSAVLETKIRSTFAPCSLGAWPTPLMARAELARALGLEALWLKREDLAGGNKVRGLEFLLAGAAARGPVTASRRRAPRSIWVTVPPSHCSPSPKRMRAAR